VEGFIRAKQRGSIMLKPFNSLRVYIAFAMISAATTAITVFMTVTFFTVVTAQGIIMEPTFSRNEILLCNRFTIRSLQGGDTVLYRHEGSFRIGRILAKGGDTIAYTHNTFMVNNIPLSLGVFTDAGRAERGLGNDTRLFSELNSNRKYSVYHSIEKENPLIPEGTVLNVGKQHFFIAGDNRTGKFSYSMPHADSIIGRIEGILAGTSLRRYLQKPFVTLPVRP
jgi:signal peptidase I